MRFNFICSPEMSISSTDGEVENEPHAFVHFEVDEEKAVVPLDFVSRFPVDWRGNGWDKTYLFKTFWSPTDGETPQDLLKRVPEIPCFEKGSSLEKAGYYRASVLAVEESKSSLQELLDRKRLSVVPINRKWSSFDNKHRKMQNKPSELPVKAKKKKGINRDATRVNLSLDMKDISSQFSFLKNEDQSSQGKVPSLSDTSMSPEGKSFSGTKTSQPSHEHSSPKTSSMEEPTVPCVKKEVSSPSSSVTPPRSSSRPKRDSKVVRSRSDSTSSSDSSVEVKKVKLDPDFTPLKYEALKEDLKIAESRLKQARIVNQKLNSNLKASEDSNSALQAELVKLKEKLKELTRGTDVNQDVSVKDTDLVKKEKEDDKFERKDGPKKTQSEKGKDGVNKTKSEREKHDKHGTANHQNAANSIRIKKETNLTPEKSNANSDTSLLCTSEHGEDSMDASQYCDAQLKEEGEINESTAVEGYQLLPGIIIPGDVWKLLQSLAKGEKKDIPFIKDLSKYAHGPETLAASTVCGTKKGGRKKDSKELKEEAKKPGLRKDVLQAVRAELIKRVEKEVGKIEDPDSHPRTNPKRYYEAIRGAQKRLKELGFGLGSKSNKDIDKSILQSH